MNAPIVRRGGASLIGIGSSALGREAKKEIGLGNPPDAFGSSCDQMLADQCSTTSPITIAEVAQWRVDIPVADSAIGTTFGDRLNVWGTPDNTPPAGVTSASNTLATPQLFASDMVLRGIRIRVLVEPEARTIMGNFVDVTSPANLPGSPDVWTVNDYNHALSLVTATVDEVTTVTQNMIPSEFLWGIPTWKAAYAFMQAYEIAVLKNHQDALIKEPLTQIATIQPFAEAEAAGLAFASNQDRALVLNDRLLGLGIPKQFVPVFFKRLGCLTVGGVDVGDFTASRESDASSAMFGGIGVPQPGASNREPYLFNQPIFWPAGHPMAISFIVNNNTYQADFQRWLSVTGGNGGNAGQDLNLPFSNSPGMSGIMPTVSGTPFMAEQSLDATPVNVFQQVQTNRALNKGGTMMFEIGAIGFRMSDPRWGPVVARAIQSGAIAAPQGFGSLTAYLQPAGS